MYTFPAGITCFLLEVSTGIYFPILEVVYSHNMLKDQCVTFSQNPKNKSYQLTIVPDSESNVRPTVRLLHCAFILTHRLNVCNVQCTVSMLGKYMTKLSVLYKPKLVEVSGKVRSIITLGGFH